LQESEYPSSIVLSVGEERALALTGLAMAGYRWSGAVSGDDPGAVSLTVRRGELPTGAKPGAGVPEQAVLHGVRAGSALVRLELRRPWEAERAPARQIELTVEVLDP
jgi:predicted secreted protein